MKNMELGTKISLYCDFFNTGLTIDEIILASLYRYYAMNGKKHICYMKNTDIMKSFGFSERSFYRMRNHLINLGYIRVKHNYVIYSGEMNNSKSYCAYTEFFSWGLTTTEVIILSEYRYMTEKYGKCSRKNKDIYERYGISKRLYFYSKLHLTELGMIKIEGCDVVYCGKKSADLAVKSADLAVKSADLAVKSADLAVKSADLAVKSADLPVLFNTSIIHKNTSSNTSSIHGVQNEKSKEQKRNRKVKHNTDLLFDTLPDYYKDDECKEYILSNYKEQMINLNRMKVVKDDLLNSWSNNIIRVLSSKFPYKKPYLKKETPKEEKKEHKEASTVDGFFDFGNNDTYHVPDDSVFATGNFIKGSLFNNSYGTKNHLPD